MGHVKGAREPKGQYVPQAQGLVVVVLPPGQYVPGSHRIGTGAQAIPLYSVFAGGEERRTGKKACDAVTKNHTPLLL